MNLKKKNNKIKNNFKNVLNKHHRKIGNNKLLIKSIFKRRYLLSSVSFSFYHRVLLVLEIDSFL